jgi:hypothetical protein
MVNNDAAEFAVSGRVDAHVHTWRVLSPRPQDIRLLCAYGSNATLLARSS